ncbi:MAG TPA: Ku protein [Streptosporangiaceae bacterium]|jgi:DNA end-binding protein Ku|nr:Ku protein [Streptosporangiaceae bacterium]
MRAIWRGTISFGLVSIPVKLYTATEAHDVSFRQVHASDGGRIRYKRVCEIDGEEVPYGDIAKGYELPDGEMVVLSDEDFSNLPLASSKEIDVMEFVPADQIDPLLYSKAYYAEPDKSAAKPYVLMRDTLADSDRVAVVKVSLRSREALGVLRAMGDILVVHTLLWPEEVRDAESLAPQTEVTVRKQEIAMASSYIDSLAADFDPSQFTDEYKSAVEELVEAKTAGREVKQVEPSSDGGEVIDLVEALRASVEAAKAKRSGGKDKPAAKPAAAAKKQPAKRAKTG